jgi:hypothetical protein
MMAVRPAATTARMPTPPQHAAVNGGGYASPMGWTSHEALLARTILISNLSPNGETICARIYAPLFQSLHTR